MVDTAAQGAKPTLEDFPEAEIIGGAVILDGKNMGTLTITGEVDTSAHGDAYLAEPADPAELTVPEVVIPDPIPENVFDPADHEPVKPEAKAAVRFRKQNEVLIDAMNSPTAEEEAAFQAAEQAHEDGKTQTEEALNEQRRRAGSGDSRTAAPNTKPRSQAKPTSPASQQAGHEASPSSGAAQQPPASY